VSGRPLDIEKYAKNWYAIIAAWLPGSEGQGVADVLFGNFPFTGIFACRLGNILKLVAKIKKLNPF